MTCADETCQHCHVLPRNPAGAEPMNSRGNPLLAMLAITFIKVVEIIYIKSLSKSDGKRGKHGKRIMGPALNIAMQPTTRAQRV